MARNYAKPPNPKRYLTSQQLADRLELEEPTMRTWRSHQVGPPFIRWRGRVLYEIRSVERWEKEQLKATPTGKTNIDNRR